MLTGVQGSGSHSVHHQGPAFSCYATQERVFLSAPLPSSCLQSWLKEKYGGKENLWSQYPSEHCPQSSSLSSLSFHRVQVAPLHLLHLKVRHRGGMAAPKEPPRPQCQFTKIAQTSTTNFSQISWLMLGMNAGGFPNRRPLLHLIPLCFPEPKHTAVQVTRPLPSARTRVLLKYTANRFRLCVYAALLSFSAQNRMQSGAWKKTLDWG